MKLRRAMAVAAATAAIAPLALLSAPAAFATDESPTPTATESATETPGESATPTPTETETTPAPTGSASESASSSAPAPSASTSTSETAPTPSGSTSTSSEPSDEPSDPAGLCEDQDPNYKSKLDASLSGLPGKIAVGSGWHPFTLNVKNPTQNTVTDVLFYAGVGPSDENAPNAFKASQVTLQAKVGGSWVDIKDEDGYSVNYLDLNDIKGGTTVSYQLRVNVRANAPIGAGLTIGGGLYFDEEANCLATDQTSYIIQIVKGGTDTGGTKPQEGGKTPVPTEKPNKNNTQQVTGSLASTGSSSALPMIGLVGGIAVVAGAGAVFVVRRRKSGDATA